MDRTPEWYDFNDPCQRVMRWSARSGFLMGLALTAASHGRPENGFMLLLTVFMCQMVMVNEYCAFRQRKADRSVSPTVPGDSQER